MNIDSPKMRLPYLTPWALSFASAFQRGCIWSVPTDEKIVALTFDDGPGGGTSALLDALKDNGLVATFFILGDRIEDRNSSAGRARIAALKRMLSDGHEIGFHGFTHRSLTSLSEESLTREVARLRATTAVALNPLAANSVRFFRPPFGRINGRILSVLRRENISAVNASILPGDSYFPAGWTEEPDRMVGRVVRELRPGAIICLHAGEDLGRDDRVFTMSDPARLVALLAPRLREKGYRTVTVSRLVFPAGVPKPAAL